MKDNQPKDEDAGTPSEQEDSADDDDGEKKGKAEAASGEDAGSDDDETQPVPDAEDEEEEVASGAAAAADTSDDDSLVDPVVAITTAISTKPVAKAKAASRKSSKDLSHADAGTPLDKVSDAGTPAPTASKKGSKKRRPQVFAGEADDVPPNKKLKLSAKGIRFHYRHHV